VYAAAQDGAMAALEEVIVTAERRQQSLQDVPISITAMNEETLAKYGIDELEDFGPKVPNVVVNEYFGIATTFRSFIRGIGAVTVEVTQDPAVALYVDGIYVGSSYGGSFEASDLERIEVLRGPQGTLYGRNATGGAINLISKKPELGNTVFSQSMTVGNYGKFKSHSTVNLPLGDSAALRIGYLISEQDGTVENIGNGDDYGIEDRSAVRLALRAELSDTLTIDLSAEKSTIKDTTRYSQVISGTGAAVTGTGTPINVPLGPPGAPTVDVIYTDPVTSERLDKGFSIFDVQPDDNDILGASLTLTWDLADNMVLKSITGYRDVDATQFTQVTGTIQTFLNVPGVPFQIGPSTLGTGGIYEQEFEQLTQEFQLVGNVGENLDYVAGLYYYRDEGNNFDLSGGIGGPKATDLTDTENSSIAVYGQATYSPGGGPFHITVGARYSQDDREAVRTNLNANPPFIGVVYDRDFSNFSPSLTVAYDINDSVNAYAKVVTGYRSGGTSTLSFNETLFQNGADEETITSYELGLKGEFMDRRLRMNAALFAMDYMDYQGSIQTGPSPADRDILNVGDNDIQGLELDVTALLSDGLVLSLGLGYLDTEMGERSVDPGTGAPPTSLIDVMPLAPELSYTIGLDYETEVFSGQTLSFNVNYAYQDESESGIVVGTSQLNDDVGLLDASISLANINVLSGNARITLWGKNLSDEEYAVSNIGPFAMFGASEISPYGDPRTYGLTVAFTFD
jgi:iron complex outermembrane receptor protein